MAGHGAIVLTTIGALIDHDMHLAVHCAARDCWHHARVDLVQLASRLGRDHGSLALDLRPYFRCSKCGSRDVSFSLSSGDTARMVPTHSRTAIAGERPEGPRRRRRSRK